MTPAEVLALRDKADPLPGGRPSLPDPPTPAASFDLADAGGGRLAVFPHPAGAGHLLARTSPDGRVDWRQR